MDKIDKTLALLALGEALYRGVVCVGTKAPICRRLSDWMKAPLKVGDLAFEVTTWGPRPERIGLVSSAEELLSLCAHERADPRVTRCGRCTDEDRQVGELYTTLEVIDPPCGSVECENPGCIHRHRWHNASFARIPRNQAQLREALDGGPPLTAEITRDTLVAHLRDSGIDLRGSHVPDSQVIAECGDSAAKWAHAFARAVAVNPGIAADEATMIGWFANAIESRPKP